MRYEKDDGENEKEKEWRKEEGDCSNQSKYKSQERGKRDIERPEKRRG